MSFNVHCRVLNVHNIFGNWSSKWIRDQIKYNFNDYYVNDDEKTLFVLHLLLPSPASRFVSLLPFNVFLFHLFFFVQFPFLYILCCVVAFFVFSPFRS